MAVFMVVLVAVFGLCIILSTALLRWNELRFMKKGSPLEPWAGLSLVKPLSSLNKAPPS